MNKPFLWLDGMRARFAAILLVALFVQFAGGEIIFRHMDTARLERYRAERLAERLVIAETLIGTHADAAAEELLDRAWRERMTVSITQALPPHLETAGQGDFPDIRERIAATRERPPIGEIPLVRVGKTLEGAIRLENGNWLHFRSEGHFEQNPILFHYIASGLLLLGCVALIAMLFARMIGGPLRQIVDAAETARRDEPVTLTVKGPREVRQVATAFDQLQTRLLDHLREQVQSLAAMSHDLRTPLARMRLNASGVEDQEIRAALQRDIGEIEAFISSILDYLRGDDAEPEQRADIASIIMTVVDEACDMGEDVSYNGPSQLEMVTRPLKLKRVVRNVVQNAVHHAGNARVRVESSGGEVVITVDDDGPGIPQADLEAVFEPFVRLDQSRSRKTGGAGLGLAITRRLINRLNGAISLRNRAQGGLRVVISLSYQA